VLPERVELLGWIETRGVVRSAEVVEAFGVTRAEAATGLWRLYKNRLLCRRRDRSWRTPFGMQYRYWLSTTGEKKLKWLRGGE